MNTLRNLKILKTSSKSYANKINLTSHLSNSSKNNNFSNIFRSNTFLAKNKSNFQNNFNNSNLIYANQKKSFATRDLKFAKQLNPQYNNFNSELDSESNEAVNFNLIYNPESNVEENDINKIFNKFEDPKILKTKKANAAQEVDKSLLEKNMLYIALLDINKRFPIKNQYDISNFEKIIKAKLYKDLNSRKNIDEFTSNLETDGNDLEEKIRNIIRNYKSDSLSLFVSSLSGYIESLLNETKAKYSEYYFKKFVEEIYSLKNFLKSLMDKNEINYYGEHLYLINNKVLINLINELDVLVIESLGKAIDFSADFAKSNQEFIIDSINKYNLLDFESEKNFYFKISNNTSLLKSGIKINYFTKDFLSQNLITFIANSIPVLAKQYGENSTDVATFYYMLAYINLKLKNFEKAEEYLDKCYQIYLKNKKDTQIENVRQSHLNDITHLQYLYMKSQLVGLHAPNKKETFQTLKQASELIDKIESNYYSSIANKNNLFEETIGIDRNNDFSALKFKVNYNLALFYKQYNFIMDEQISFEKCLQINTYALKTNKNLMQQYNIASKFILEMYDKLNLSSNIYNLAKRNFGLSYYIINDKAEQAENLSFYSDLIIRNINNSFDKFNYQNLLNPKSQAFNFYKSTQENFVISLISYFQKEKNNFTIGSIFDEYLQSLVNTDFLQAETLENTYQLLVSYYNNVNNLSPNYSEANKHLIKLRDQLQLEEFLQEELTLLETIKTNETTADEASPESQPEIDEFQKELNDKFYFYRKNKDSHQNWLKLAISFDYNIIINSIKNNEYEEALSQIDFLLNFLNKLNETKSVGSVIEHPYLLINLNLLAAHYHLIRNQKIYSVKYLKAVNSMITRFDWGSNNEINAYLNEMVKLINSL